MARRHEIPATPENMVWGHLDSANAPVLSVNSGDTVTLHSFPTGGKETLPDDLRLVGAGRLHEGAGDAAARTRSAFHHRAGACEGRASR